MLNMRRRLAFHPFPPYPSGSNVRKPIEAQVRPAAKSNGAAIRLSVAAILAIGLLAGSARAASHQVLHSFNFGGMDPAFPLAGVISDSNGNLYGATNSGGAENVGAVFELSPNGSGGWTEKVLYSFKNNGLDGNYPYGRLVLDGGGNLYGTTYEGGIHCAPFGCGTAFELSPNGSGGYNETVLHSFGGTNDGDLPYSGMTFDSSGNLYGTTYYGGIHGGGTVFELSPRQGGGWTETILHSFNPDGDAAFPAGPLTFDHSGNFYGTTSSGGIYFGGTVFEFSPREGGGWTEALLHNFGNGNDGYFPFLSGVTFDASGNLYGTTAGGGIHCTSNGGCGTVYELSPNGSGGWDETVLHSFGNTGDGTFPESGVIFDSAGNMYGTTYSGGVHLGFGDGSGTVFELTGAIAIPT